MGTDSFVICVYAGETWHSFYSGWQYTTWKPRHDVS